MNNNKLSHFINNFYTRRSWNNLPTGFPNCSLNGLSIEEQRLFDGIVLAWKGNTKEGRMTIYKSIVKKTTISVVIIFSILAANKIYTQTNNNLVTSVNAATVSATLRQLGNNVGPINVGSVVESTFSGVLKNKRY